MMHCHGKKHFKVNWITEYDTGDGQPRTKSSSTKAFTIILYCHSHSWWRSSHERWRDGRWLTKNSEFIISWKKIKLKFENMHSFRDDHHSPFDRESSRSRAPTTTLGLYECFFFQTRLWGNNGTGTWMCAHIEWLPRFRVIWYLHIASQCQPLDKYRRHFTTSKKAATSNKLSHDKHTRTHQRCSPSSKWFPVVKATLRPLVFPSKCPKIQHCVDILFELDFTFGRRRCSASHFHSSVGKKKDYHYISMNLSRIPERGKMLPESVGRFLFAKNQETSLIQVLE